MTAPAVHKFPQLPDHSPDGYNYGSWGWHLIDELDGSIIEEFIHQGYKGAHIHFFPRYCSFARFIMDSQDKTEFTWLMLPRDDRRIGELHSNNNPAECFFLNSKNLYVSAGWGIAVLGLAKMGIFKMEKLSNGRWQGIHWDGEKVIEYTGRDVIKNRSVSVSKTADDLLVEALVAHGIISVATHLQIRQEANMHGESELALLILREMVTPLQIIQTRANMYGCEYVELSKFGQIPPDVISCVPAHIARRYKIIPIKNEGNELMIVMADPSDLDTIDSLNHLLKVDNVYLKVAYEKEIEAALEKYYGQDIRVGLHPVEISDNHVKV